MKRMLWVILVMAIGATYPSSLFPLFQETYRLGSLSITVLFAIYALFLLPSLLVAGFRGAAWGLKRVLTVSITLSLLSAMLFLAGHQAWILYIARIIEGIAFGTFTGTSVAFLLKQTSKDSTGQALTLSGITISVGFGLGPAISGLLIQYAGFEPLRLPFALLAVLLLSGLVVLSGLPGTEPETRPSGRAPISLGVPESVRPYFWSFIALAVFTVFTLNGIVLSLIPSFAKHVIHTSNLSVSGLLILLLLGGGAMAQLLRLPQHPMNRIRYGVILLLAGSWVTVFSGQLESLALLWTGIFIQAIGSGWTFQVSLKLAGQLPKPEERPKVISTYYLAAYSGFIVPIVGVGVLTFFVPLFLALTVLNVLATVLVLYLIVYSFKMQKTVVSPA